MEKLDLSSLDLPEKERKILEAAINIFSEKGFSASTTSEIAKNAGVAEGTIFRYFKTKKDILRGILLHSINLFGQKLLFSGINKIYQNSENKDLRTFLKELIYDRLKLVDSMYTMARVVITEALYHDDIREALYNKLILKASEIFDEYYNVMVQEGILRNDLNSRLILRSIVGNVVMLIIQKKLFGDKFALDDFETEVDNTIDVILYGISRKNDPS